MATSWTDSTLTANTSQIRGIHVTQLRTAINAERTRRSMATYTFTDTLTANTTDVRALHVTQLRAALTSWTALSPAQASLVANTTLVKKGDITELRTKVNTLEGYAKTGTTSGCSAGCAGLCQTACTGGCRGGCTVSCGSCSDGCTGGCGGCGGDSCGASCFIAGTLVLMSDKSWKPIDQIVAGDMVIGIDGNVNTVIAPYKVWLGDKRSIIGFKDGSLKWSAEHLLWVRTKDGRQYWGTHDIHQYNREKMIYNLNGTIIDYKGLTKEDPVIVYERLDYAHVQGWKNQEIEVLRDYGSTTPIYSMAVNGSHTYIVNGYVATGFVDDTDYDYGKVDWKGLC